MIDLPKESGHIARMVAALVLLAMLLSTGARVMATTTTAPNVLAFGFSPTIVNTGLLPGALSFTMQIDTSTALCSTNPPSQVNFQSPSGHIGYAFFGPSNLKPGTTDTYVSIMTLPAGSEQGTWTLYDVALIIQPCDAGSRTTLYLNDMQSRGFPTTFVVKNSGVLFLPSIFRPR